MQDKIGMMEKEVGFEIIEIDGENFFRISHHDRMRPFFMSIVSDSNHWMFISSNGGLTAGRISPDFALFPYYTEDKLTELAEATGSKTILKIQLDEKVEVWEPFSARSAGRFLIERNLYKSIYGNKIIFEEINHTLELIFRYQWNTSHRFGFVKKASLINLAKSPRQISILDGIQSIMPAGVGMELQLSTSNLVNAYKRNELQQDAGLGIFSLSATIVDKAEPSEALKANVAWSIGLENPLFLLSTLQLDPFRNEEEIENETDIKGENGAYLVISRFLLDSHAAKNWKIIANVNQDHSQVIDLCQNIIKKERFDEEIEVDIHQGTQNLIQFIAAADGLQHTADQLKDARHLSNVLFNIMRGGTFDHHYQVEKRDFVNYLKDANTRVFARNATFIDSLDDLISWFDLVDSSSSLKDPDLQRLCIEYLPLKFSRRHGDPSRPWNRFSINTHDEIDGSKVLDYEGNWRDIFQNWEALVHAYPMFVEGMIFKFLNASTFDGFNPYRLTKKGFDWEVIEKDNPWSYIGYWGDHQLIYLLKFLEFIDNHQQTRIWQWIDQDLFVYANVPYKLKPYQEILNNPKNTIDFDAGLDKEIRLEVCRTGADGALLGSQLEPVHHVNFVEKILAVLLSKLSHFIPEGGIWMNTQRPEWNDANNALVGNGVSMVTLYYLRRFLKYLDNLIGQAPLDNIHVSEELGKLFYEIKDTLVEHQQLLAGPINDADRKMLTDILGEAGSTFRNTIYSHGFSGRKASLPFEHFRDLIAISMKYTDHSIAANQRPDHLYHAYNLLSINANGISLSRLSEMLEGQVAVISSGFLTADQVLKVLDALRYSILFRADQHSYLLYPDKRLPGFLEKNAIAHEAILKSDLLKKLVVDGNRDIVSKDVLGGYHFNGNFRNADDLKLALGTLKGTKYQALLESEFDTVLQIFEEVFNHKSFTGRSGTFYAYEGLGSIYWHMVSKLHLAVQEACAKSMEEQTDAEVIDRLVEHFYDIASGIGIHKPPALHGAFPTDPYSHTPKHRGAQQPGMTGQVKEDILVRFGELGVYVNDGQLSFNPQLLQEKEFCSKVSVFSFIDVHMNVKHITLEAGMLGFTYCQTPVIYRIADKDALEIKLQDGKSNILSSLQIDKNTSEQVFMRTGEVVEIQVSICKERLRKSNINA